MKYPEEPPIHCLMMSTNEKGTLPQHSCVVNVSEIPAMERIGWVLVGIDPADQHAYELWLMEKQFSRVRWVSDRKSR